MAAENPITARHGEVIDLGPCLAGKNLNLLVLRGFAPMDVLAEISSPDVYDQVDNPTGTQRDLKAKHAEECWDYAIESLGVVPEDEPRTFPEIILNARDAAVVEVYDLTDHNVVLDVSSFTDEIELETAFVGLRVLARDLEYPKPTKSPQISRVDGNHRLYQTDKVLQEWWESDESDDSDLEQDFPKLPFTLTLGLERPQEARLFRDINGEHVGMESAHLATLTYRIASADESTMKQSAKLRPLWLAYHLAQPGRAFEGMVFFGGSKRGLKESVGIIPPIRINALKTTIATQLKAAEALSFTLDDEPDVLLELLDRYWKAVKSSFPQAWANRRDYILLQAIGLGGFAKFGGDVLARAADAGTLEESDFRAYLALAAQKLSLARSDYTGIAGAGGADVIYERLTEVSDEAGVKKQAIVAKVMGKKKPTKTALDK